MQLIQATALKPVAWKNGGGMTRQIASWPDDAALDAFAWRVSIAEVAQAGSFSSFAGIDRIIVVTHGGSMTLIDTLNHEKHTLQRWRPFAFSGDVPMTAELPDGPTQDFNLMVRRNRGHGRLAVRHEAQRLVLSAGSTVLHCAAGSFRVTPASSAVPTRLLHAGDTLHLHIKDRVAFSVDITPERDGAALIDARIAVRQGLES